MNTTKTGGENTYLNGDKSLVNNNNFEFTACNDSGDGNGFHGISQCSEINYDRQLFLPTVPALA